jgi:hypothetical protein
MMIGSQPGAVWVGVVFGSGSQGRQQPVTDRYSLGGDRQDSFCVRPVRIETYPITCEPGGSIGELPGCVEAKGCFAFGVIEEACDSFNYYWDSERKALAWWRR